MNRRSRRRERPTVVEFVNEGLGHTSYLVDLGNGRALVVDPARLPVRQQADARSRRLDIAFTADTHTHADYVSGGGDLAAVGAARYAPNAAQLRQPHIGLTGGEEVEMGRYRLRALATPGHTPDHLAYLLVDNDDRPLCLFSGGSLMVNTVGRTDLDGPDNAETCARAMFHSLHTAILTLPDDVAVYPTHGAGSFCAAPAGAATATTIGHERANNQLLGLGEDAFVERLIAGFGPLPPYFHRLPDVNRLGPRAYSSIPTLPRVTADDVARLVTNGAAIIDVRPIAQHAAAHPAGAISIQLRSVFASWLAWLVDPNTPIVFMMNDEQDESELVSESLRVGIESFAGRVDGDIDSWRASRLATGSTPLLGADAITGTIIDVRHRAEFAAAHVPGAVNIELGDITTTTVPAGPLTVMCGHGERAMTAASLLRAAGHRDVAVLDGGPDHWAAATELQLERGS